ncbi:MAG TPA: hypothetical protein VER03_05515 [Bryobacteraceae bacterium]|nr:hypothetical protein [Bryobacteraceae bacterium]
MAEPERGENIIYENVPFERRWMRFERSMWLVLSLSLLAASFGVFGRGAHARQTQRSAPLTVEYDSVVRSRTQTPIVVKVDGSATQAGHVRLLLSGALLGKARLLDIVPKPASEEVFEQGVALTFKTLPGKPASMTLVQKVEGGMGRVQSHLGVDHGSSPLTLNQLILP